MTKNITLKVIERKDSRKNLIIIILFLYGSQFSSIWRICRYMGNKNYDTIKHYIQYLLENKIIYKVKDGKVDLYYINVRDDPLLKTRVNYRLTKHKVSLKLNKIMQNNPQLKEIFSMNGVENFTNITKSNIPKHPFKIFELEDLKIQIIVKYLNLIFLATKVLIAEEKIVNYEKSMLQIVKREARICEMWIELKSFLDKELGRTDPGDFVVCMAKINEINQEYKFYHDYFDHQARFKTSFSEYIKAIYQILLGRKKEFSDDSGLSMYSLSKIKKRFTDNYGRIDFSYLSNMRRIECANIPKFIENDIIDLCNLDWFSEELNQMRWEFDEKSRIEQEKNQKIIKQIYPQMQIS